MSFNTDNFQVYNIVNQDFPTIFCYNSGDDDFSDVAASDYFADLLYRVRTGDKLLVKTNTSGLSFSGTFRNDGSNVYIDWDNTLFFETQMADVSAANTTWFTVPPAGVITKVYGTQWSAITSANAAVTFSIGGTAITGGSFNVLTSGSAGSVYSAIPTAANVTDGSTPVEAVSDGASSTAAIMTLGFKIICPAQI